MSCEICGEDIRGYPVKVRVEGALLSVCRRCADLGEKVDDRKHSSFMRDAGERRGQSMKTGPKKPSPARESRPPRKPRAPRDDELDIVENHAEIIKTARGTLSHEEFASGLREKATVIQKIEAGKLRPTLKLARAIEKQYHVILVEKRDATDEVEGGAWKDDKKEYAPTLGDYIKKKG